MHENNNDVEILTFNDMVSSIFSTLGSPCLALRSQVHDVSGARSALEPDSTSQHAKPPRSNHDRRLCKLQCFPCPPRSLGPRGCRFDVETGSHSAHTVTAFDEGRRQDIKNGRKLTLGDLFNTAGWPVPGCRNFLFTAHSGRRPARISRFNSFWFSSWSSISLTLVINPLTRALALSVRISYQLANTTPTLFTIFQTPHNLHRPTRVCFFCFQCPGVFPLPLLPEVTHYNPRHLRLTPSHLFTTPRSTQPYCSLYLLLVCSISGTRKTTVRSPA
ncbi:hypothetical protein B0H12DRAFT_728398 [Mycena haematopus]|nr:hypothetical protein B0H12DRAFT_728398 [Mycena haematopus]